MTKFHAGDIVRPVKDWAGYELWRAYRYKVLGYFQGSTTNVDLTCLDSALQPTCKPHENHLELVQSASLAAAVTAGATTGVLSLGPATVSAFQPGDIVQCLQNYGGQFTSGKLYTVKSVIPGTPTYDYLEVVADDFGTPNSWSSLNFTLWRSASANIPLAALPVQGHSLSADLDEACKQPEAKSEAELRKERIWRALQGAAKQ